MRSAFAVLLLFSVAACKSRVSVASAAEPIVTPEIDLSDGVDRDEAQKLAWRYFGQFHGACGAVALKAETVTSWVFSTAVGYGAAPGADITVRKDGSKITQEGSPDLEHAEGRWSYRGKNFFGETQKG